ncbi:CD3324 family protein [Falsibacillus pallidus]|uniref:CD3324 family protein n=1 Tax=Falsibacillus pallidus TaxID=493781 RepID=UPI003D9955D3
MKYLKAAAVLPDELLVEIQKYVQGEAIYIPKPDKKRTQWGAKSGSRRRLDQRNEEIRKSFRSGTSIDQLAAEYFLSLESIKKIVYIKARN